MKLRWTSPPQITTRPVPSKPAAQQWHAVSIVAQPSACQSARGLRGIRYLSDEAPRLPLAGCALQGQCNCTYKHHKDRRGQARRDEERLGMRRPPVAQAERRESRGRRKVDI